MAPRLRCVSSLLTSGLLVAGCGTETREFDDGMTGDVEAGAISVGDGGTHTDADTTSDDIDEMTASVTLDETGQDATDAGSTTDELVTSHAPDSGTPPASSDADSSEAPTSAETSGAVGQTSTGETSSDEPSWPTTDRESTSAPDTTGASTSDGQTSGDGDTSSESSTSGDTSSSGDETSQPVPVVTVEAHGSDELIGFQIGLVASGSSSDNTNVTFTWSLVSRPGDSEATGNDIVAAAEQASFYPDVAGQYVLRVTATSESGESANSEVTVQGYAYDVGYLNVAGDQDSWTQAGFMVKSDGTQSRQVGCYFQSAAASESDWLNNFQQQGQFGLMPYFPTHRNTPARIAYNYFLTEANPEMYIAGPNTDCNANPPPQVAGGFFPAFSPNGERVVVSRSRTVIDEAGSSTTVADLVTYSVDGTDARVVRSNLPDTLMGATWEDNETLVWAESDGSDRVYRAKDADGAFNNDLLSEVILDCAATATPIPAAVNHAMLRGGSLFVSSSYTNIFGSTPSHYSIWRLQPTLAGTFDCDQNAATNLKVAGDDAHDYDVSPDGSRLLYFVTLPATETETSSTHLYLRDLSYLTEPVALSAEPSTIASGAHFAANGRQIVWTDTLQVSTGGDSSYERPSQSRVVVANYDGGNMRTIVSVSSTPSQARMFHTGGNASCAIGVPGANTFAAAGSLLTVLGLVLRRRRRR